MSFKKEFEECIESIRAIEVSFSIAKDLDVLLPTFFDNNLARLKKLEEELKRIKKTQSGIQNRQRMQERKEELNSIWQTTRETIAAKMQREKKPVKSTVINPKTSKLETLKKEAVKFTEDKSPAFPIDKKSFGIKAEIETYLTVNDRFIIQKDLFNDDARFMDIIVNQLNTLNSMEETLKYLDDMFAWDWESESAWIFREILEKRFA
ncbi:hypothetical protein FACS189437_08980 [Bacteroidia bacterium]|nr:hypothetical protein FACS189437_08980 [Bacteroidia bacterium]